MTERGRFAPSPTGPPHPGTLLSALLAWLDARSRGAEIALRIEDVDTERSRSEWGDEMREALTWLGLDWDRESRQSADRERHREAIEALRAAGRAYACRCSRADVRRAGQRAADGGWRYPGTCRDRDLEAADGRAIRFALPPGTVEVSDEGGEPLGQKPLREMGDPVIVRRNGDTAYHLAVVVDDAHDGITRVVRGRDIAVATSIHVALQRALGYASPAYRHHLLLLEPQGNKLAKLHGSVSWRQLAQSYSAETFCGRLANVAGLTPDESPVRPTDLVTRFSWSDVRRDDVGVRWTGARLEVGAWDMMSPN